ncbi:MAG: Uncharacterised protein [Synechococcus sp. MIT S9220]|nr:MAG: Uncharacterised protein [Synechococcus sp. MIT S9220]
MTLKASSGREAVLEQTGQQWFFGGQRGQAVADVAGWLHAQFPAQYATAATVVSHGDDGRDVAAVTLEATQQRG